MSVCFVARRLALALAFLPAVASLAVHAEPVPESQWQPSQATLFTLVQDGYRIVSVIDERRGEANSTQTFYLQREQGAFKCIEQHQIDQKTRMPAAQFACFELAQPFSTSKGK
ncbi:hypothetical protein [Paraburkholderia gardini]|uniref:Uncharacterized protein n=1 Tax=Paraburkholderia gardini TaxID=2823469 RepID=A0ABM8U443_9BURK|nr:hypothetical protein [Paraburkholderia gardini]CAG4888732.1 hypothetical protein R69919_00639 [Paraburkholderia gardini]CAG4900576.1 hypothetical protein R54767_02651 [Paraburkholderia gardini]